MQGQALQPHTRICPLPIVLALLKRRTNAPRRFGTEVLRPRIADNHFGPAAWAVVGAAQRLARVITRLMVWVSTGEPRKTTVCHTKDSRWAGCSEHACRRGGRRCRSPHPTRNYGGAVQTHHLENLGVTKPRLSVAAATAKGCGVTSTEPLGLRAAQRGPKGKGKQWSYAALEPNPLKGSAFGSGCLLSNSLTR